MGTFARTNDKRSEPGSYSRKTVIQYVSVINHPHFQRPGHGEHQMVQAVSYLMGMCAVATRKRGSEADNRLETADMGMARNRISKIGVMN
jgi:hypothetical protein